MADGPYRYQQPGPGQYYYPQQNQQNYHARHLVRNGSPVNSGRGGHNNDIPSPSRSPVSQTSSHNPFGMFNQTHQPGQHVTVNGGNSHQRYMHMNLSHKFQHQPHQQHHNQQNHHHQQNHGGHAGITHQHNFSAGNVSNSTPHFTPSVIHNGTSHGTQGPNAEPVNEHWQQQLQMATEHRQTVSTPHHHCRKETVSRANHKVTSHGLVEETPREPEAEEHSRATMSGITRRQEWGAMDMSGQGIRALPQPLFEQYTFLERLYIDNNKLTQLPPSIGRLRNLRHLDISNNELLEIPEEIGMLGNLRSLLLFDNNLRTLPCEIGYLYQLEILGIEGNPLNDDLKAEIMENGTRSLVNHLKENAEVGPAPMDRDWHVLDSTEATEKFSVLTYNILCDKAATQTQYKYTPTHALSWDYRRDLILQEIKDRNADIVCLQEVDMESYNDFFRRELAYNDYKGVYWPRSRARTMPDKEAKFVDGCATFFKGSKYICLDKQMIDFANVAINRPDMKGEHDIFNRVMPRDHIAVVTFFENRLTGSRVIVVNAHIFWDTSFKDVKLVQVAILLEQVAKLADGWAKHPPCTDKIAFRHTEPDIDGSSEMPEEPLTEPEPSLEYSSGSQIPLIISGDFNSEAGSGVFELLSKGTLPGNHTDLAQRGYGSFTREGMGHPFSLKSAYGNIGELNFTNYTPGFIGVLDYIWYSTNSLQVTALLGDVDDDYLQKVPGFPNHHFPSDHLALKAEFSVKIRKERKVVEANFGPQKERKN